MLMWMVMNIFQQLEEQSVSLPEELAHADMDCSWDCGDDNREMTEDDLWQPFFNSGTFSG